MWKEAMSHNERIWKKLLASWAAGIPGNTITYNTLLDACAKCGTMSRVPAIFEKMKQGGNGWSAAYMGVPP